MLTIAFILLVGGFAVAFLVFGNTDPAVAAFGGAFTGFCLWLILAFVTFVGSAFTGCNTLDMDNLDECSQYDGDPST